MRQKTPNYIDDCRFLDSLDLDSPVKGASIGYTNSERPTDEQSAKMVANKNG